MCIRDSKKAINNLNLKVETESELMAYCEFFIKPLFRGLCKEDLKKLLSFIQLQKVMFKSLWKLMVTGWQRIELTFQQWKNRLGLLHQMIKLIAIKK